MTSVHHDSAYEALVDLADEALEPATFRAQLSEIYPTWGASALPMKGYNDADQHAAILMAHCLHDCLPAPFNSMKFDWEREHGFGAVMSYVDNSGCTAKDLKALVDAAVERCQVVMNDR